MSDRSIDRVAPGELRARSPIVLIGMMGSGKTTVGRALAERLGWRFLDTDAQVVADTGSTISEIFEQLGEAAFRAVESRVIAEAMTATDPVVISVGGGAVLAEANRVRLRAGGVVVWLRARPETVLARLGSGIGRPVLQGDPAGTIHRLDALRRPIYTDAAHIVVDVDDLDPQTAAGRVIAHVEHEGPAVAPLADVEGDA